MVFSKRDNAGTRPHERRADVRTVSAVGALGLSVLSLVIPVDFVTESPGPTFNTIGEFNSKPLLEIEGAQTYPVSGNLDMTTVSVAGGPNSSLFAVEALATWLEDSTAVLPSDLIYDPSVTSDQVNAQNSADMTNSQEVAQAAALTQLGIDYTEMLTVSGAVEGGPSQGLIQEGDVITALNGQALTSYTDLTGRVNASAGQPVTLTRDGNEQDVSVTPSYNEQGQRYVLGLYIARSFEFPMTVNYGLEEVGGPSAGMMFALGIIDELTEGEMTGGIHFAGTGTIDADGTVGSIGGIEQKMQGAADAGATVFLAPADNCGEVVGNVPRRLNVIKVATLDEAVDAVTRIGQGEDPATFPTCS
ncbi:PDZ domain-containing protein [Rothia sp. SD9660Na]|uniref:YlbL family protein n=1 Tax=Rothia sp. SD9660Na TaxID=3047030 RepID=UPI0024B941E3|nr:S16 family serine protease [Rothia sp. SD9660Na]WHS51100.1 PDZ domain-containing protein [Rothia sp. SD9660Na]